MDAPHPSAMPTFAHRTPLRIGAVGLKVRAIDRVGRFYRDVIGLDEISRGPGTVLLGAGGVGFLQLEHDPDARPDDPTTAGLYHNAFLMPTRADLARWVAHIAERKVAIAGASDHGVSEAFYLDDPEGNGVEVYADRPPETWSWEDGRVTMPTVPLDVSALMREIGPGSRPYAGAPGGLRIGHVHLRVGDIATAESFYASRLGLDITRSRQGATFMSSGHYHHHIGANVWHSAKAGSRDERRAGLSWLTFEAADQDILNRMVASLSGTGQSLHPSSREPDVADPWGTRIRIVTA